MREKIKIAISGIGNRSLPKNPYRSHWDGWIELIQKSKNFELVGAHDPSESAGSRLIQKGYLSKINIYADLDKMLNNIRCDALLICNPAEYHAITINKALDYNLHILVEKPFVTHINDGLKIIQRIKSKKIICGIIQNWRYKPVGLAIYNAIKQGLLGRIGHIFFRYVRNRENPSYPDYIFNEDFPLLYAMGIHHLDLFRFILDDNIDSISANAFKPPWSMYKSQTGVNLFIKTENRTPIVYTGTISSQNNIIHQESLIIEGEKGSIHNESQWLEPPLWFYPKGQTKPVNLTNETQSSTIKEQYDISDKYILDNFYQTINLESKILCSAESGLLSVSALEASRLSIEKNKTVFISDIIPSLSY